MIGKILTPFADTDVVITVRANIVTQQVALESSKPINMVTLCSILNVAMNGLLMEIGKAEMMIVRPQQGEKTNGQETESDNGRGSAGESGNQS
jgi:hypothetical protein